MQIKSLKALKKLAENAILCKTKSFLCVMIEWYNFVGYHHQMKVEFDSDNARLGKVLYALAKCPLQPEFRLGYTVKDPEAARNSMLARLTAMNARLFSSVFTTFMVWPFALGAGFDSTRSLLQP